MNIFVENYKIYCYIHIPKNSGTYYENVFSNFRKYKLSDYYDANSIQLINKV